MDQASVVRTLTRERQAVRLQKSLLPLLDGVLHGVPEVELQLEPALAAVLPQRHRVGSVGQCGREVFNAGRRFAAQGGPAPVISQLVSHGWLLIVQVHIPNLSERHRVSPHGRAISARIALIWQSPAINLACCPVISASNALPSASTNVTARKSTWIA